MKWHFLGDGVSINNARTSAMNESSLTQHPDGWSSLRRTFRSGFANGNKRWTRSFDDDSKHFNEDFSAWQHQQCLVLQPETHRRKCISLYSSRLSRRMKVCANVRSICLDIQSLFPFKMSCQHLTRFKYIFISRLRDCETMNIDRENNGKLFDGKLNWNLLI
jgi:hypothetical protein